MLGNMRLGVSPKISNCFHLEWFQAIANRLEAIAISRLEALAIRLEAMSNPV